MLKAGGGVCEAPPIRRMCLSGWGCGPQSFYSSFICLNCAFKFVAAELSQIWLFLLYSCCFEPRLLPPTQGQHSERTFAREHLVFFLSGVLIKRFSSADGVFARGCLVVPHRAFVALPDELRIQFYFLKLVLGPSAVLVWGGRWIHKCAPAVGRFLEVNF